MIALFQVSVLLWALGCDSADECDPIEEGEGRVTVGFWENDTCSGEPMIVNSFPIEQDAPCYCWPGNSGENSADSFTCNDDGESFTYVQYNSLTCGDGDNSPTTKTVYTTSCEQDTPSTIYAMIVDYSACE